MSETKTRTLKNVLLLALWKALGGLISLATAIGIANIFGASGNTDAYFLARKLVTNTAAGLERAFQLVQVPPMVQRAKHEGIRALRSRLLKTTSWTFLTAALVAAAGYVYAPQIVAVIAPGFDDVQLQDGAVILRILIVTLPIWAVTGLTGAALNALRLFSLPAVARLLPRLVVVLVLIIAPLFLAPGEFGLPWLALASVVGTILMAVMIFRSVRRTMNVADDLPVTANVPEPKVFSKARTAAMLIAQVHMVGASWIDMAFGSLAGVGSIATLELAQRLTNVAPGVASNSIISVYYTEFASAHSDGDMQRLRDALRDSYRAALVFTVPIAVLLGVLSDPLVSLILEHGAFSEQAAESAQSIVVILSVLLPVNALLGTTVSAVFADPGHRHLMVVTSSAALSIAIRILIAASLIGALGVLAVPLSSLVSMSAMFAAFLFWQTRMHGSPIGWRDLRTVGTILLAALVGGLLSWLCKVAWAPVGEGRLALIGLLLVAGAVGGAGFFVIAWLFRIEEVEIVVRRLRKVVERGSE